LATPGAARQILVALALALPIAAGCEDEGPPPAGRRKVAVKDLPATILGAAKKELPGINFEEAWENLDRDRKLQSYEIKGRAKNGKIREVRVGLDGKILESE
jgi:hypothetical protein